MAVPRCAFLLFFLSLFDFSASKVVTHHFNIGWIDASPDGYDRPVVAINGHFPPPTIYVTIGDELIIHTTNNLGNSSATLHFHGLWQKGSTAQDGPFQVSQCGVPANESFTYQFFVGCPLLWPQLLTDILDQVNQAGTFFYHSRELIEKPITAGANIT